MKKYKYANYVNYVNMKYANYVNYVNMKYANYIFVNRQNWNALQVLAFVNFAKILKIRKNWHPKTFLTIKYTENELMFCVTCYTLNFISSTYS